MEGEGGTEWKNQRGSSKARERDERRWGEARELRER